MALGWFRKARSGLQRSQVAWVSGWGSGEGPRSYEGQAREAYLANPIAQRAVRLVAEGAGSAPFVSRPAGHKALELLRRPNAGQAGVEMVETVISHLALHGNAYLEFVRGGDGAPAEIYVLRPERVTVETGTSGWPVAHVYRAGGNSARFPVEGSDGRGGLLHIRSFHPLDDHYGAGALAAASGAVAVHNAAARWNKALLDNAARPSGALVFEGGDGTLSGDQFARLKSEMEAGFQGAANAGRPMLLEGGLKWQALSLTPAEMDFAGAREAAAREIALAFGVPPMLLGLPGDNTYSNYREANVALWRLTILPVMAKMCAALGGYLRAWWPELELDVDRDAIPALSADRERLWAQVGTAGFLSDEEKRAMLGI